MEASCLDFDNILNFNYDTCDEVVDANKQPLPLPTYPEEQEEELEWVSNFPPVDEYVLAGSEEKHHSPVSVLENSSSSSNNSNSNSGTVMSCCGSLRVPVRARSKHRRKRSFANIPSNQLWWNQHNAKSTRAAMRTSSTIGRKCQHCGAEKTPQWRAGPSGPKTLCNACGVRYKSGRLVDEYRPASSPTFLSQLHSNSHRKIIEMRRQKQVGTGMATMDKG